MNGYNFVNNSETRLLESYAELPIRHLSSLKQVQVTFDTILRLEVKTPKKSWIIQISQKVKKKMFYTDKEVIWNQVTNNDRLFFKVALLTG